MLKKKKKRKGWDAQIFANDEIFIEQIIADERMQQRVITNESALLDYERVLASGGELPAVKCVRDSNGGLWLWDGFHTLQAAKLAGKEKVRAEISDGSWRDAWLKSLGANAKHGIRRTHKDKRKAVMAALTDAEIQYSLIDEDGRYSFRSVAKLCRVFHGTVSKLWENEAVPALFRHLDELLLFDARAGQTNQVWFAGLSKELSVPAWFIANRYAELMVFQAAPPTAPAPAPPTAPEPVIEAAPTTAPAPAATAAPTTAPTPAPTTAPTPAPPTAPEPVIEAAPVSLYMGNLEGGEITTSQMNAVTIHNPSVAPLAVGAQATQEVLRFLVDKYGLKTVSATRPAEGWTAKSGAEISEASRIIQGELDSVHAIMITVIGRS